MSCSTCICTGGDQLTVARSRGFQRIRINSTRRKDRLEGLVPIVEDWHAKVSILGVSSHVHVHVHVQYMYNSNAHVFYHCAGYLEAAIQMLVRYGPWNPLPAPETNQPTQCGEGSQQVYCSLRRIFYLSS